MWIAGIWIPASRELLYGIGLLLVLVAVAMAVIIVKRKKKEDGFPPNRIFKGRNLERAGKKTIKELDYDDMPVVGLKWQNGETSPEDPSYIGEEDEDDEDGVDDGYKDLTVVEKTIQEKAKQLQFTPPKQSSKTPKKEAKTETSKKKDATMDKMDFFTTGKSAL